MTLRAAEDQIRRIGLYRAAMVARRVLSVLLIISTLCNSFIERRTLAPFYILIFLNVFPFVLSNLERKRAEEENTFPLISKKYKYTAAAFRHIVISLISSFILIVLWLFSLNGVAEHWTHALPFFCVTGGIGTYIVLGLWYTARLRKNLLEGKI